MLCFSILFRGCDWGSYAVSSCYYCFLMYMLCRDIDILAVGSYLHDNLLLVQHISFSILDQFSTIWLLNPKHSTLVIGFSDFALRSEDCWCHTTIICASSTWMYSLFLVLDTSKIAQNFYWYDYVMFNGLSWSNTK